MTIDISRDTFDPDKRYSSVLSLQGGVLPDAARNEAIDIHDEARRLALRDTLGRAVVPADRPEGFRVSVAGGTLAVQPGLVYVDGQPCRSDGAPSVEPVPPRPRDGRYVAYVESWPRKVSQIQDPDLRDPALGGPDTTARTLEACRVRVAPLPEGHRCRDLDDWRPPGRRWVGRMAAQLNVQQQSAGPCAQDAGGFAPPVGNQLYRVQVLRAGALRRTPRVELRASATSIRPGGFVVLSWSLAHVHDARLNGLSLTIADSGVLLRPALDRRYTLRAFTDDGVEIVRHVQVRVRHPGLPHDPRIVLGSGDAAEELEAALAFAAVGPRQGARSGLAFTGSGGEIGLPDPTSSGIPFANFAAVPPAIVGRSGRGISPLPPAPTPPTLVFSRDNGSTEARWIGTEVDGDRMHLTVRRAARDPLARLRDAHWVELRHDDLERRDARGVLVEVLEVGAGAPGTAVLTVDPGAAAVPDIDKPQISNPFVRVWQALGGDRRGEVPASRDAWLPLEDGIEVRFEAGLFEEGVHWQFPARAFVGPHGGDIEWPRAEDGTALSRPPDGPRRRWAPLAILEHANGAWRVVEDCRKVVAPLCGAPAVHVTAIEDHAGAALPHDTTVAAQIVAQGLRFVCDEAIDPLPVEARTTCRVNLELPLFRKRQAYGYLPFEVDGTADVEGDRVLRWRPTPAGRLLLLRGLPQYLRTHHSGAQSRGWPMLLRLRLCGHFLWAPPGDARRYLDGELFGRPADGGARVGVHFASGDQRQGGVLDGWLWLDAPDCGPLRIACRQNGRSAMGRIQDACGPVPDVLLFLRLASGHERLLTTTDDDGRFTFPVQNAPQATVVARAPDGREEKLDTQCWQRDCGALTLECATERGETRVVLTDDCGPVAGVRVRIEARGQTLEADVTDASGVVVFRIGGTGAPRGEIVAEHPSDGRSVRSPFPCCGALRVECVRRGLMIVGTVRDDCGAIAGALVEAFVDSGARPIEEAETGRDGRFLMRNLPQRRALRFVVYLRDGHRFDQAVGCRGDLGVGVSVSRLTASVDVRDAAGNTVSDALLDVLRAPNEPLFTNLSPTRSGWRVRLPGPGEYLFVARRRDGAMGLGHHVVPDPNDRLTIEVHSRVRPVLSGAVRDGAGPVVGAVVTATMLPDRRVTERDETKPETGAFRFVGLRPGTYELIAEFDGRRAERVVVEFGSGPIRPPIRPGPNLDAIRGIGPARRGLLEDAGITDAAGVAELEPRRAAEVMGVSVAEAARIIEAAGRLVLGGR